MINDPETDHEAERDPDTGDGCLACGRTSCRCDEQYDETREGE